MQASRFIIPEVYNNSKAQPSRYSLIPVPLGIKEVVKVKSTITCRFRYVSPQINFSTLLPIWGVIRQNILTELAA